MGIGVGGVGAGVVMGVGDDVNENVKSQPLMHVVSEQHPPVRQQ